MGRYHKAANVAAKFATLQGFHEQAQRAYMIFRQHLDRTPAGAELHLLGVISYRFLLRLGSVLGTMGSFALACLVSKVGGLGTAGFAVGQNCNCTCSLPPGN